VHLDIKQTRHHDADMRSTLTLDDDLAARLADLARETGKPLKAVVNETLRRSLGNSAPALLPFVIKARPMNLRPGIDPRRLNELAWEPEEKLPRRNPPIWT
jgi:hypothetical protein